MNNSPGKKPESNEQADPGSVRRSKKLIRYILAHPNNELAESALKKKNRRVLERILLRLTSRPAIKTGREPKLRFWKGTEVKGKVRNFRPRIRY